MFCENLRYKTASTEDEARVDVSARGFWVRGSRAFTDIRVFNPLARTYRSQNLTAAYKRNKNEKKTQIPTAFTRNRTRHIHTTGIRLFWWGE